MGKQIHGTAVNYGLSCHHPITDGFLLLHAEITAFMQGETIDFDKCAWIDQLFNTLAGKKFTLIVTLLCHIGLNITCLTAAFNKFRIKVRLDFVHKHSPEFTIQQRWLKRSV